MAWVCAEAAVAVAGLTEGSTRSTRVREGIGAGPGSHSRVEPRGHGSRSRGRGRRGCVLGILVSHVGKCART